MKTKLFCLLFLVVAICVKGFAQGATKSENYFRVWLQNADSATCEGKDTVPLAFFKTPYTRLHSEKPFAALKEVWVVLQKEGWEPIAWKLGNEYFPVELENAIQKRGVGTRLTVSVKTKTGAGEKGYASQFYLQ